MQRTRGFAAAVVLSLGGGFQAYFPQKRDGSVRLWEMDVMAQVADFCRAREAICHRAEPVPQIGLLYAGDVFYRRNTRLFGPWHNARCRCAACSRRSWTAGTSSIS